MELKMGDSPPISPKPRRRSSFFERRTSSIMPVPDGDVHKGDAEKLEENLKQKNIELYMEHLNKEKTAWENYSRSKKHAYKEAKEKSQSAASTEPVHAELLPEDREFLSARPDMEKIVERVHSLSRDTESIVRLRLRLQEAWIRSVQARLKIADPMLENILNKSRI